MRSVLAAAASRCEGRSSGSDLRTRLPAPQGSGQRSRARFQVAYSSGTARESHPVPSCPAPFGGRDTFAPQSKAYFRREATLRRRICQHFPIPPVFPIFASASRRFGTTRQKRTLTRVLVRVPSRSNWRVTPFAAYSSTEDVRETPAASPRWSKGCRSRRWSADWRGSTAAARGPRVPTSWPGRCARCAPNRLAGSVRRDNCT